MYVSENFDDILITQQSFIVNSVSEYIWAEYKN